MVTILIANRSFRVILFRNFVHDNFVSIALRARSCLKVQLPTTAPPTFLYGLPKATPEAAVFSFPML